MRHLLVFVALCSVARADAWHRDLPALSGDGKTIALPVRGRFSNFVKDDLTARVDLAPIGSTEGVRVELFDATAPPGCAALSALDGEASVDDQPCKVSITTHTSLRTLARRLRDGHYRKLPMTRSLALASPFSLEAGGLAVSVRVTPDGYVAALSRAGKLVASQPGTTPEPMRAADGSGPASRVVLDGIDAVFPGHDLVYVRLAWTDELNGRKVSFGREAWIVLSPTP